VRFLGGDRAPVLHNIAFLIFAVLIAAFYKAVALDGFDSELDGNFDLDALGDNYAAGGAAGLLLALDIRLAAAFGLDLAEVCFGADLNRQTDVNYLLADLVAVALALVIVVLVILVAVIIVIILVALVEVACVVLAGIGIYVHSGGSFLLLFFGTLLSYATAFKKVL